MFDNRLVMVALHARRMTFVPSIAGSIVAVALAFNASASPTSGAVDRVTAVHAAGWLLASSAGYVFDDLSLDIDASLPRQLSGIVATRYFITLIAWSPAAGIVLVVANRGLAGNDALPAGLLWIEFLAMLIVSLSIAAQVFVARGLPRTHMGLAGVVTTASTIAGVFLLPWRSEPWVDLGPGGTWEANPFALMVIGLVAIVTAVQVAYPPARWPALLGRGRRVLVGR